MRRLSVVTLLALVAVTVTGCDACSLIRARLPAPFLRTFTPVGPSVVPPSRGLDIWVEGETLPTGTAPITVTVWPDMRQTAMTQLTAWRLNSGAMMTGTVVSDRLRTAAGESRGVRALRCVASPRCSYPLTDRTGAALPQVLTDRPYTIFAIVKRSSDRGSNYMVMTDGVGCEGGLGGISCTSNTVLHLGWVANGDIRLGQYYNDVSFPTRRFNPPAPDLTLLAARSGPSGKLLAILEPFNNQHSTSTDRRFLDRGGRLFAGGTPWGDFNNVPDWHFEGDIFALLVYSAALTDDEMATVANYLRGRYGPPVS